MNLIYLKHLQVQRRQLSWYSDGLEGRGSIAGKGRDFSLLHSVQNRSYTIPTGTLPPGVKRPDLSSPSSTEIKNGAAIPLLPHTSSWCGA
jgi:hypothetical protein